MRYIRNRLHANMTARRFRMHIQAAADGKRWEINSATALDEASGFLWNRHMVLHQQCRGFAIARYIHNGTEKYIHTPNLEAKTFIQPEQPYYAHHPGRFFYLRDTLTGELYSLPHEPVRAPADSWLFSAGTADITWQIQALSLECRLSVHLPVDDVAELWEISVTNRCPETRSLSLYPYIPIGYMSWMNQGAHWNERLGGIIATSVRPWQRLEEWKDIREALDITAVLAERKPDCWETCRKRFEGEGGLHNPSAIQKTKLSCEPALYESPVAAFQYNFYLMSESSEVFRFMILPAQTESDIEPLRRKYLSEEGFTRSRQEMKLFHASIQPSLEIHTPDANLDSLVNHWLPNQMRYLGELNRLTLDPQTRNYLQDGMAFTWLDPSRFRAVIKRTLSQQRPDGSLPDGIKLREGIELTYINRIPHTDHCLWLPVCIEPWLAETGDLAFLDEMVVSDNGESATVATRISRALEFLLSRRDERLLCYMEQGDWCDPMNMAGARGRGVSSWLTIALVHALTVWSSICAAKGDTAQRDYFIAHKSATIDAVRRHLWDGNWYSRGISDDGIPFGVASDAEGRMYLNPQSWALMAHIPDENQKHSILQAVRQHLETPFGPVMLAPAYTHMHEHIGRLTQKFPGSAENGSVYNHAAAFWIHALYQQHEYGAAWHTLANVTGIRDSSGRYRRGQLPVFIPNYWRGAWKEFPSHAGRSSHLFNTGSAAWLYRSISEGLCGFKPTPRGLRIECAIPAEWNTAHFIRHYRQSVIELEVQRTVNPAPGLRLIKVIPDDGYAISESTYIEGSELVGIREGKRYKLSLDLPLATRLVVIMGVSGSGKSTIARQVALKSNACFMEADDYHTPENKARMAGGVSLTDELREPWMNALCQALCDKAKNGTSGMIVLPWSGLRQAHRSRIRSLGFNTSFFLLQGSFDLIQQRMNARIGHFMSANLLASQFQAQESMEFESDVAVLDAALPVECLEGQIMSQIESGFQDSL